MRLPRLLASLLFLCLLASLAPFAIANQRVQGWCEKGAEAVVLPGAYPASTTKVQRSYPKCTVTVYVTGSGGTLATLYSDNNNTPLANPFTADKDGHWFYYILPGHTDVQLSGAGFSSPYTVGDIQTSYTNYVIDVQDFGAKGDGIADDTVPIQTAINLTCLDGGKLFIPQGNYKITSTLNLQVCHGVDFGGVSSDEFLDKGSILQWYGASGGTMLSFYSSEWSRVHDFTLDGRNLAGIGVLWTANTTTAPVSRSNQRNIFDHVYVLNASQSPGYGIAVMGHTTGGASGDDISQNVFSNNSFGGNLIGYYQDGTQTLANEFSNNTFHANATNSMYIVRGDVQMIHNTFLSNPANGHVWITPTAYFANFERNIYENTAPTAPNYTFASNAGPNRPFVTNLIGEKVQWLGVGGKIMDFEQAGTINVIGGYNDVVYGGQRTGQWYFTNTYAPTNAEVNLSGNTLAYNDVVFSLGPRTRARIMGGSQSYDNVFENATGIFNNGVATLTATDSPFTASMVGYTCWIEKWTSGTAAGILNITGYSDANNVTMSGNAANSSTARYFRCGRSINAPGSTYVGYTTTLPSGLTADSVQPLMHLRESDQALASRNAVLREQGSIVYLSAASIDDASTAAFSDWVYFTRTGATATGVTFPLPIHIGGIGHQGFATFFQDFANVTFSAIAAGATQSDTLSVTLDTLATGDTCVVSSSSLSSNPVQVSCFVSAPSSVIVKVSNLSASPVTPATQTYRITFFKWTTP